MPPIRICLRVSAACRKVDTLLPWGGHGSEPIFTMIVDIYQILTFKFYLLNILILFV